MTCSAHQKGVTVARVTASSFRVSLFRLLRCCMAASSSSSLQRFSSLASYALAKASPLHMHHHAFKLLLHS